VRYHHSIKIRVEHCEAVCLRVVEQVYHSTLFNSVMRGVLRACVQRGVGAVRRGVSACFNRGIMKDADGSSLRYACYKCSRLMQAVQGMCDACDRVESSVYMSKDYLHSSSVLLLTNILLPSILFGNCQHLVVHVPDSSIINEICHIHHRKNSILPTAPGSISHACLERVYCEL